MKKASRPRTSRTRDLVLYFVIGIGVVAAALVLAFNTKPGTENPAKWFGFGLFSLILIGVGMKEGRQFWHLRAFWMGFGLVFMVHLLVFVPLLRSVRHVPAIYFVPVYLFEIPLLGYTVDWFMENFGSDKKRRDR